MGHRLWEKGDLLTTHGTNIAFTPSTEWSQLASCGWTNLRCFVVVRHRTTSYARGLMIVCEIMIILEPICGKLWSLWLTFTCTSKGDYLLFIPNRKLREKFDTQNTQSRRNPSIIPSQRAPCNIIFKLANRTKLVIKWYKRYVFKKGVISE